MSDPYVPVRPTPAGPSTAARLAATAARCGFAGVVVLAPPDGTQTPPETTRREYLEAVTAEYDIDVVGGVEVDADTADEARGHVGALREERTVVAVRGGTPALNRFAVESPRVDALTAPMRGAGEFNHVLAKAAASNGVRVAIGLGGLLYASGEPRVGAASDLRKLREILAACDSAHVVDAGVDSHLRLRAPRELAAVGEGVGFGGERVHEGLAEWGRIAARNRERHSEAYVAPGVRREP